LMMHAWGKGTDVDMSEVKRVALGAGAPVV
jgi:hypothetical protein